MLLSELLKKGAVVTELKARGIEETLGEMIDALILAGCLGADDRQKVLISLLKREALSTTGLGDEIAIPHAKLGLISEFVGAIAISREGVDFRAADGKAVRYVFLVLSPEDEPYVHLRLLGTIATLVRQNDFLDSLAGAEDATAIVERIAAAESATFKD